MRSGDTTFTTDSQIVTIDRVDPTAVHGHAPAPTTSTKFFCNLPSTLSTEFADSSSTNAGAQKVANTGVQKFAISVTIHRHPLVYVYRIVMVMAFFSLLSLGVFCLDPEDDAADRIAIAVSLMLTATACSIVISSSVPVLGHLTFLDKYILLTFFFIGAVGAEIINGRFWEIS